MEDKQKIRQEPFIGFLLLQRYIIVKKFNQNGAHGTLFEAHDQVQNKIVLVKITENQEMNFKELSILMALQGDSSFPIVYGGGAFEFVGTNKQCFIVMEKLGQNLEEILDVRQKCFNLQTICHLGIFMLENIKKVHSIGCIHNDIKLENILVEEEEGAQAPVKLIDFGLSTSYLQKDGSHVPKQEILFSGNPIFCSIHSLLQMTPSRRDDLISLAYVLLYLHQGKLWFFQSDPEQETLEYIAFKKQITAPDVVCGQYSMFLRPFVEYVYTLDFDTEPDYELLKQMLFQILAENDLEFSKQFDWTQLKKGIEQRKESNQGIAREKAADTQECQNFNIDIDFDQCHKNIQEKLEQIDGPSEKQIPNNQQLFNMIIQQQQQNGSSQSSSKGQFEGGNRSFLQQLSELESCTDSNNASSLFRRNRPADDLCQMFENLHLKNQTEVLQNVKEKLLTSEISYKRYKTIAPWVQN